MIPPNEDSGPAPVAWIELPDKGTVPVNGDCHFGRVEGNEIINPDNRISRRHAVVQRQGRRFVLVDLGSTNGTFLNDTRIFTARKLRHLDVILVGSLRYIFHQPSLGSVSSVGESAQHTIVAVGKTSCWMMLVAPPEPADRAATEWAGRMREATAAAGGGVKKGRGAGFFAHWRDNRITPGAMCALVQAFAKLTCPPTARVTLHHGAVRVGPAAVPGEENLLGAEATFTHKMEATAAAAGVNFLLSEAAVHALGPAPFVVPLSSLTSRGAPGDTPLFTVTTT